MDKRIRLPKENRKSRFGLAAVSVAVLSLTLLVPPAQADPVADQALSATLQNAASSGFLKEFHGQDQVFDGTRTVEIDAAGKGRLKANQQGTILVRFYSDNATNQVLLAGGSGTSANSYGAILANGVGTSNRVRVDFPAGMQANLDGPAVTGAWHTFAYSVDATPGGTTARTVTSIDGSTTTQFPNFASWFSTNPQINALDYLTIGGAPGVLANSSNNGLFNGKIAFVAFVPTKYSQAQLSSITSGMWDGTQVFYRGDATTSKFFRIPFLLNTSAGTLIAGTDVNRATTGDSADNIDAALRRKANASSQAPAAGWDPATVPSALHMKDYADEPGYKQSSASVIDGAIVQDTLNTQRIFTLTDAFPWNGGVFEKLNVLADGGVQGGRARSMAYGDGFATIAGKKYLLLSSQNIKGSADGLTNNINNNTDRSKFDYVADVNGPKDSSGRISVYNLQGTPRPYSSTATHVSDSNLALGTLTNYSLDAEFALFNSGTPLIVQQKSTSGGGLQVPLKIFYEASPLQMYNTSYILQTHSDDDGQSWVSDQLISGMVKRENSRWYLLGPGRSIQIQKGAFAGRLVVPVYYQGGTSTEVIFSDDNGKTWSHGEPLPTSLASHESSVVELPDGSLQIYVRNTSSSGGKVLTSASGNGGASWRAVGSAFGDNSAGINSQISTVTLQAPVVSPTTGTAQPAFLMTTAMSSARTNGVANIGLVHEDGNYAGGAKKYRIEWIKQYQLTGANEKFAYSSMAQLNNGKVGILYEAAPTGSWSDGLQAMYYRELEISDLLN
ncbi:sialidase family protein [Arthrobacter alpinus]|uniref:sialidase family protein n=1 Tax=Arthrobacter alpinus TaxID=656366 RepID=UPI0009E6D04F|nr:exo-alpha-sialidase [Arthrobacter alpinus]